MKRAVVVAALAAAWVGAALPAGGATAGGECIYEYRSDIRVHEDGGLTVAETIVVEVRGEAIRHGIFRDIPTRRRTQRGTGRLTPLEIVSATLDGRPEPWHGEPIEGGRRIYIGRPEEMAPRGRHTYVLTYRLGRLVSFGAGQDELYYNVTGNFWRLPIASATAVVTLPGAPGAGPLTLKAWTGPLGARGTRYTARVGDGGEAIWQTTAPLAAGEGITISLRFPKGLVHQPTRSQAMGFFLRDHAVAAAGTIALLAVLTYFVTAWVLVGRDPVKGLIVPQPAPPEGMCPAAVRYVARMGFDQVCLAAAILNMAVKGFLTIHEDDGIHTLRRSTGDGGQPLSNVEAAAYKAMFTRGVQTLVMNETDHEAFRRAVKVAKRILAENFGTAYFAANTGWFAVGVLLAVAGAAGTVLAAVLFEPPDEGGGVVAFLGLWLTLWTVATTLLVCAAAASWGVLPRNRGGIRNNSTRKSSVGGLVMATVFLAIEIGTIWLLGSLASFWLPGALVAIAGVTTPFFRWLKRPTPAGREAMDQIDGFLMYLRTDHRDSLELAADPAAGKTPELFERLLPYAVALGAAPAWAGLFGHLGGSGEDDSYQPIWYDGASFAAIGTIGLATAMSDGFSDALSSASASPSSGGSDGGGDSGGSSGGGDGGGGGGGW